MPTRLTTEKLYQGEYWTNVYYLSGDIDDSLASAAAIVAAERVNTLSGILFTKYRLDDATENTDNYVTVVVNQFGSNAQGSEQMVPLFNVVRVDFQATSGRPSRKYYRGMLLEAHVNFNTISAPVVADIQTNVATPIANLADYVDVDGQQLVSAVVHPFVGMRQLRRGSKKKSTPSTPTPV